MGWRLVWWGVLVVVCVLALAIVLPVGFCLGMLGVVVVSAAAGRK